MKSPAYSPSPNPSKRAIAKKLQRAPLLIRWHLMAGEEKKPADLLRIAYGLEAKSLGICSEPWGN